jgi:thioesterase domain-containing protein
MVATYAEAIRKRQPRGPYAVAGYSYGAAVAFEIAKLLESQGERVDFVGSIDMPPRLDHVVDGVECAVNLAFFLSLIDRQQAVELPQQLRASPAGDPCVALIRMAPPQRLVELDIDLPKFRAWTALAYALLKIARPYMPAGTVESVTVFAAQPLRGTREAWLNDQLKGWDDFSRVAARYVEVPGEHHAIMGPKHVAGFQKLLRTELDRAMGDK